MKTRIHTKAGSTKKQRKCPVCEKPFLEHHKHKDGTQTFVHEMKPYTIPGMGQGMEIVKWCGVNKPK